MTIFIQTEKNLVRWVPYPSSPKNLMSMYFWKWILSVVIWSVCQALSLTAPDPHLKLTKM